jgi:precorrin isomerase
MKIIGIKALKKKSTVSLAITEGKTNEIPELAHATNQVKKEAILSIVHAPTVVVSINHVMSNSTMNKLRIDRHLTIRFAGEQR